MNKVIIGVDPDSKAHGVSCYVDGRLTTLSCMNLMEFLAMLAKCKALDKNKIEVHVEDVCAVSAAFNARNKQANINVKLKMAQHIGMCKQSQIEVERVCEWLSVKVVKHKISKMWKKDKAQFEKVTGWKGRSNEDSRSAAYFGWLGVKAFKQSN